MTPEEIKKVFIRYGLDPEKVCIYEPYVRQFDGKFLGKCYRFTYPAGKGFWEWNFILSQEAERDVNFYEMLINVKVAEGVRKLAGVIKSG